MAFRYVDTEMWDSAYIDSLEPLYKLSYVYTFTNVHTNVAGCYRLTLSRMIANLKLPAEQLLPMLAKFEADQRIIYRDNWMLVRHFIEHQKLTSATVRKGIENLFPKFPEWARRTILADYPYLNLEYRQGTSRVSKPAENSVENTEKAVENEGIDTLLIESGRVLNKNRVEEIKSISLPRTREDDSEPSGNPGQLPASNLQLSDFERVPIGNTSGIRVQDVLQMAADAGQVSYYVSTTIDAIKTRYGVVQLSREPEWALAAERCFHNGFSQEQAIEAFDLLEQIRKLKHGTWKLTPKNWEEAVVEIDLVRHEAQMLESGKTGPTDSKKNSRPNQRGDNDDFLSSIGVGNG